MCISCISRSSLYSKEKLPDLLVWGDLGSSMSLCIIGFWCGICSFKLHYHYQSRNCFTVLMICQKKGTHESHHLRGGMVVIIPCLRFSLCFFSGISLLKTTWPWAMFHGNFPVYFLSENVVPLKKSLSFIVKQLMQDKVTLILQIHVMPPTVCCFCCPRDCPCVQGIPG